MDDRISQLPDDILSYILTMLSIKDLLKTSVLFKRWSKLWGLRKDLYFDIHNVLGTKEELLEKGHLIDVKVNSRTLRRVNLDLSPEEFVKRVDQFLKNFPVNAIDSFSVNFYFDREQNNIVDKWITFAIARGVERINLLFLGRPYENDRILIEDKRYKFDFGLFSDTNASTLKHLRLEHGLVCHPTNCDLTPFKHLRSLSLEGVKVDEIFIESLLSNCRLLEELSLNNCEFKSTTPMIVSSSLCHLNVSGPFKQSKKYNNAIKYMYLMLVDCLKLTSLECDGGDLSTMKIYTPVLKRINFAISSEEFLDAFALFATFPELEIMHLKIFGIPMVPTSLKPTQPLKHLKQLDCFIGLDTYVGECDLIMILNILQTCPLLQKFSGMIAMLDLFEKQEDIRDVEVFSHGEIKVIELEGCVGNWFEIEFVMNVLKYAHKLEQIVVGIFCLEKTAWKLNSDPLQFQSRRERMIEKLQAEEVVGKEKIVFKEVGKEKFGFI